MAIIFFMANQFLVILSTVKPKTVPVFLVEKELGIKNNSLYCAVIMERILKIWFDGEWLYGQGDDGEVYRQSLLWYKPLMRASSEERQQYVFSGEGIHWRNLDTDVSFESFLYPEAEPSDLQRFFLTHPEINIAGFAERSGINASLLRNYINGFKNPSPETVLKIKTCLHTIGKEYLESDF